MIEKYASLLDIMELNLTNIQEHEYNNSGGALF